MTDEKSTKLATQSQSLLTRVGARFGVDPGKMMTTLKSTAFKLPGGKGEVTNEQMMALMVVADQYHLNPWTREIYAFLDKWGNVIPVLGVDGWARIINEHEQFDGIDFDQGDGYCSCTIYRKDRKHATKVTEYMDECERSTDPWKSHPRRMLRHKALIQCARVAFGFAGIHDQDEAERIVERDITDEGETLSIDQNQPAPRTAAVKEKARAQRSRQAQQAEQESPPDAPPPYNGPTFAEIEEMIRRAKTEDEFDQAADLIGALPDAQMRQDIGEFYTKRRSEIKED